MDVDVFSPLPSPSLPKVAQSRPPRLRQWQPPLPDYLPLEVDSDRDQTCDEATTGQSLLMCWLGDRVVVSQCDVLVRGYIHPTRVGGKGVKYHIMCCEVMMT